MSALKKKAARSVQRASAQFRPLPGFIIIGGIRCGTTSLIRYLGEHKSIGIASTKEVHFYDWNFDRGVNWYRSWFPIESKERKIVAGESSPSYLLNVDAPGRVAATQPDAKLIVLLRNPADRAISHFQYRRNRGMEDLESLEAALLEEPQRMSMRNTKNGNDRERLDCYFHQGSYVIGLKRWFELFDRDQIHVIKSEDLFDDPARVYNEVLEYLGVRPDGDLEYKVHNAAKYETAESAARGDLAERYVPLNRELYDLIGRDMNWS